MCAGISAIAITLSKGKIFLKQRVWLSQKSPFLGGLFSCPYCLSHWIVFVAMLIWPQRLLGGPIFADYIFSGFSLIGFNALFMGLAMRLLQINEILEKENHIESLRQGLIRAKEALAAKDDKKKRKRAEQQ